MISIVEIALFFVEIALALNSFLFIQFDMWGW